jgi:hypothetical protein
MRMTTFVRLSTFAGLVAAGLFLVRAADGAPPFAGDPDAEELPPKPQTRLWNVNGPQVAVSFLFQPGIPDPNQTTTITLVPTQRARGGAALGSDPAIEGAKMIVTVKAPDGEVVARYRAHPNPLSKSKYALHYTPTAEGIHTLRVDGKTPDGKTFSAEAQMPVSVWPLPKELEGEGDKVEGGGVKRPLRGPITK